MIKVYKDNRELTLKKWLFPGGEVGIKFDSITFFEWHKAKFVIDARLNNSNEVMELLMINNALRNVGATDISLFLPYVPYGRQDRVCNPGESHSLKTFASLINLCGFKKVIVLDPHSDVTTSVIENIFAEKQSDLIIEFFGKHILKDYVVISPDVGANKKASELAKLLGHKEFVRADKLRNLSTGEIIETIVYKDDFKGQDVLCPDDLADGGRTFVELAKICKAKNCGKFALYVTHGLFSKGTTLENIDIIYTTDAFRNIEEVPDKVLVKKLDYRNYFS